MKYRLLSPKSFLSGPVVLGTLALFLPIAARAMLQGQDSPPTSGLADPITRLQEKIDSGEVKLDFDPARGYLPSLLKNLEIPVSSQGLVFSKTSLQLDRIAPWSPRALYFNDDVYIGWVQDGPIMEVASIDPNQGAVFYTLSQEATAKPRFQRESTTCLLCHDSSVSTGGEPGLIVRSVHTDRYGYVIPGSRDSITTDQAPLADRWGGWYVTGTLGNQRHKGNVAAPLPSHDIGNVRNYVASIDWTAGSNVLDLRSRFNTRPYLTPHSDIVALLVLAHQASVHNLINVTRVKGNAEPLVRAMLFVKEAPLAGPVRGTSGFAAEFARQGPRDRQGRSLRDLDLQQRLFRYPLSYLIYSDAFNSLPSTIRDYVYRRLWEVLSGQDQGKEFAHLSESDRRAILGILEDTKPDFRTPRPPGR